ncbi:hypothetical protein SVIOM342S_01703 [Streptomyces violaceorubidus]
MRAATPALPTNRASTVPSSAFTRSARASRSGSEATSPRTATALSPSRSRAASSVACERPVITTRAPPATSSSAIARPIPLPPPVITAFLLLYIPISGSLFADFCTFVFSEGAPLECQPQGIFPAVHGEAGPGHPARPVGHEEQHRVGDVVGQAVAPQRCGAARGRSGVQARPVLPGLLGGRLAGREATGSDGHPPLPVRRYRTSPPPPGPTPLAARRGQGIPRDARERGRHAQGQEHRDSGRHRRRPLLGRVAADRRRPVPTPRRPSPRPRRPAPTGPGRPTGGPPRPRCRPPRRTASASRRSAWTPR